MIDHMNRTKMTSSNSLARNSPSDRPSFREAFRRAASQTELEACTDARAAQMRELCYIIAEVYLLDPESRITISDEVLDAYLVQEIFSNLRHEHLEMVADSFSRNTTLIKNKRAYLRTALYNSFFELESHYINLVKSDMGG